MYSTDFAKTKIKSLRGNGRGSRVLNDLKFGNEACDGSIFDFRWLHLDLTTLMHTHVLCCLIYNNHDRSNVPYAFWARWEKGLECLKNFIPPISMPSSFHTLVYALTTTMQSRVNRSLKINWRLNAKLERTMLPTNIIKTNAFNC